MVEGDSAFAVDSRRARLMDASHFVVVGGDEVGDVMFSRPGIAEPSAWAVYQRFLTQ